MDLVHPVASRPSARSRPPRPRSRSSGSAAPRTCGRRAAGPRLPGGLALAALLVASAASQAQSGPPDAGERRALRPDSSPPSAVLRGRVLEMESLRPLSGAVVVLDGRARPRAETSEDGRYVLEGVPPGQQRVAVRYLGRTSASAAVAVEPGRVHEVSIRLETRAVRVPDLRVEIAGPEPGGRLGGFERRRERHPAGRFIGRREIEARDPHRLSDMLFDVPGLRLSRQGAWGVGPRRARVSRRPRVPGRSPCRIRYFVDGIHLPESSGFYLDELAPRDVAGIEIYRGTSEVPARFDRRGDACGVVVVWTRDPGEGERRR